MQCPICSGVLGEFPHRGTRLAVCRPCGGVWLERDQIAPYLDRTAAEARPAQQPESGVVRRPPPAFDAEVFCPRCNTVARPEPLGPPGVSAQRCARCGGIWIERGRLARLAAWFAGAPAVQRMRVVGDEREQPELLAAGDMGRAVLGLIADDNPRRGGRAWATLALIVLNVLAFAWGVLSPEAARALLFVPARFLESPLAHLPQLLAAGFLHGGLGHLAGNMYFLWVFGDNLEDRIGRAKYLALYGLCLAGSGALYALATRSPEVPMLGASGAVAGVMGGYLALYPGSRLTSSFLLFFRPFQVTLPAWFYLGVWFFGMQVLRLSLQTPGIAWEAHIAGFLGGFAALFVMRVLHLL